MSKAGLYAAEVTQNAPADGAATTKAKGYQWLEYGAPAPSPFTPESTSGVAGTQSQTTSSVDLTHPFAGESYDEFTMVILCRADVRPTTIGSDDNNTTFAITINPSVMDFNQSREAARGGIQMRVNFVSQLASETRMTALLAQTDDETDSGWSDWWMLMASYKSDSGGISEGCYWATNIETGIEAEGVIERLNNTPIAFQPKEVSDTTLDSICHWGFAKVFEDYYRRNWDGYLSQTMLHNKYIDFSDSVNRRKFCDLDGAIDWGSLGQVPFGEQPLVYLPNGHPSSNVGTQFIGNWDEDFYINPAFVIGPQPPSGAIYPPVATTVPDQEWIVGSAGGVALDQYFSYPSGELYFNIINGALPDGMSLNSLTGDITGTPTSVNDGSVSVRCTSAYGTDDSNVFGWETLATYEPGMMTLNGTDAYYSITGITYSGDNETAVIRFNIAPFSGGGYQRLFKIDAVSGQTRLAALIFSNDYATASYRNKIQIYATNDSGTVSRTLTSISDFADGNDHLLFISVSGVAQTNYFYVDGVDEDDLGAAGRVNAAVAIATGSGSSQLAVGATAAVGGGNFVAGDMGYFGTRSAYLTNPEDFGTGAEPKKLDDVTWAEWGAEPRFWNDEGTMTDNKGSGGNMTENGTVGGPS